MHENFGRRLSCHKCSNLPGLSRIRKLDTRLLRHRQDSAITIVFNQPIINCQSEPRRSRRGRESEHATDQSDQELSTSLQLRQRHQQSEELAPYCVQHATVDTSVLKAPNVGGSAGNPGPQLQLPTKRKVPDAAQSIWFALKGDIDGLKNLFSQGLASPRDVSDSRGFSLVMVSRTILAQVSFSMSARRMLIILAVGALRRNAQL